MAGKPLGNFFSEVLHSPRVCKDVRRNPPSAPMQRPNKLYPRTGEFLGPLSATIRGPESKSAPRDPRSAHSTVGASVGHTVPTLRQTWLPRRSCAVIIFCILYRLRSPLTNSGGALRAACATTRSLWPTGARLVGLASPKSVGATRAALAGVITFIALVSGWSRCAAEHATAPRR